MTNFLVSVFLLLFLSSCSTNKKPINNLNTSNENLTPMQLITKLSYKKTLSENQILSLKNIIKKDPTLIRLLSPYQILNLLGQPRIIKNQKFVEIWQYKGKCILNIVWEKNNRSDYLNKYLLENNNLNYSKLSFKIIWLDSTDINKQKVSPEACFCDLVNSVQPKVLQ